MSSQENSQSQNVQDVMDNLALEVRNIVRQVLAAEQKKLHLKKSRGILDEIRQIIQEEDVRREA